MYRSVAPFPSVHTPFIQTLAQASRSLRRAPGFVAIATLSLGTALGLSTSVFALIDTMTHPRSPYHRVDELFELHLFGTAQVRLPPRVLREGLANIPGIAGVTSADFDGSDIEAGQTIEFARISYTQSGFFDFLGAHPRLGRLPTTGEEQEGSVAIVSDRSWKLFFANRAEIADAHSAIRGRTYRIIGVLPTEANAPGGADIWIPKAAGSDTGFGFPIVRLRAGVAEWDVQLRVGALMKRFTQLYGRPKDKWFGAGLVSLRPAPLALTDIHRAMIGAALCVLLIACDNVAALMLSRGTVRRRDYALRLALGATRGDIARDVIFEIAVLAAIGCVAGAVIATWVVGLMARAMPVEMNWLGFVQPQWSVRVLLMSGAAVLVAVVIAGGIPAWKASRTDPAGTLKNSSGGNTGRVGTRFRWLVMAELALSMTLLVGTSLMLKSVLLMASYDFGFDAKRMLSASVYLRNRGSKTPTSELIRSYREALASIRGVPGVESAALTVPCVFDRPLVRVVTTDRTIEGGKAAMRPGCLNVTAEYFRTLGYSFAEGRDFQEADALGSGAVILDTRTARKLFPHESAIGRTLKLGDFVSRKPWLPVVGIVHDKFVGFTRYPEMGTDSSIAIFVSVPDSSRDQHSFVLRASPGVPNVPITVHRALASALPPGSFTRVFPWTEAFKEQLAESRYLALVFSLLGAASLALGAAGLFSVVSYIASQRMREFAVRVALGATRENVAHLVLNEALVMALGGTGIGAGFGMWAGFLIWDRLYGVYPVDAVSLIAAGVTLLIVTMMACLVPAMRAMRADPVEVMRAT